MALEELQALNSGLDRVIEMAVATTNNVTAVTDRPIAVIPNGYEIAALEPHMERPYAFKGHYETNDLGSMQAYCGSFAEETTRIFVQPHDMQATALFRLGTTDLPQWCNHRATLQLLATPEFSALSTLSNSPRKQRELLDFIADWHPLLIFVGQDGAKMDAAVAVQRIQKLESTATINAASEEGDTAQARSLSERRTITTAPPIEMNLSTGLYQGLAPTVLQARLIYLADKDPTIKIRLIGIDRLKLEKAEEFRDRLIATPCLSPEQVFIGSFAI